MEKIANVSKLSRKGWLAIRQKGLGGSDAAAACGLNPWKSRAGLFFEKTGQVVKDVDNEILRQGRDLEDYVAKRFKEATGKRVRRNNFILANDKHPFLIADIDRQIVGEDAILECKTTSPYAKAKWDNDKIPINYELQCHHYMMVTGAKKCYIACLIFSTDFIIREIERDEEMIEILKDREIDFWTNFVQKGIIPPPDGSKEYDQALKDRFRGGVDQKVRLDITKDAYDNYLEKKSLIKRLEEQNKIFEQSIKLQLKNNDYGANDFLSVSFKPYKSTRFDSKKFKEEEPELYKKYTKESEYRRLNIKELIDD